MKILLIGTQATTINNESYYDSYLEFFRKAISKSGHKADIVHTLLDDLLISVGDGKFSIRDTRNDMELSEYSCVFVRGHVREHFDAVKTVSTYLNENNIPIINDYSSFRSSSKLVQAVQFHGFDVPVARTVFANPAAIDNIESLSLGFPCILKATYGSHGNHNYLVKDAEELRAILSQNTDREFVLQRYVPNDCDYRVLLVGRHTMIFRRSASSDSHLNNTSKGGQAELVDLHSFPEHIVSQSRRIAEGLGMTIAGVDVLYDTATNEHVFLEVNSQPQLMTGAFLDEKADLLGEYLKEAL